MASPVRFRRVLGLVVALAVAAVAPPAVAARSDSGAVANCRAVRVPVQLSVGTRAGLSGELCSATRAVPALQRAVQVLVAGTAYGRSYWDFPYQPENYSYVRAANAAGFATLNFDRIGIGESSRPPSPQVTIPSNAETIHQVIAQLRSGAVDGITYDHVVLVGHSMGSLMVWYEAAEYRDVDAVISSGILHTFDGPAVARFGATLYPAALDPRFAGRITDPGYLTTMPGTRAQSFYHLSTADPRVIEADERLKETATSFEAADVFGQEFPGTIGPARDPVCSAAAALCAGVAGTFWYGVTPKIDVPVLTVVGQYDNLLCGSGQPSRCADLGAIRADEAKYFSGSTRACLVLAQVLDSGHDLNLHRTAGSWFALANRWSAFALGQSRPGSRHDCWGPAAGVDRGIRFAW
ncbi:MAG TPA: alpha/beta hydrolase [Sporichthyaceae bacterium]|jgi:pimeloyl-ACP methyl ester carboxylesterase|nr:alpha/beta hydrolase [Sporichthyaceae bacterium]